MDIPTELTDKGHDIVDSIKKATRSLKTESPPPWEVLAVYVAQLEKRVDGLEQSAKEQQ